MWASLFAFQFAGETVARIKRVRGNDDTFGGRHHRAASVVLLEQQDRTTSGEHHNHKGYNSDHIPLQRTVIHGHRR